MTISIASASTTTSSVYTSSSNTAVTFCSICNRTAGNVSVNVYVVPFGGTAGSSNIILAGLEITAYDTYQLYAGGEKLLLDTGDSIQIQASGNSAITTVTSYTTM